MKARCLIPRVSPEVPPNQASEKVDFMSLSVTAKALNEGLPSAGVPTGYDHDLPQRRESDKQIPKSNSKPKLSYSLKEEEDQRGFPETNFKQEEDVYDPFRNRWDAESNPRQSVETPLFYGTRPQEVDSSPRKELLSTMGHSGSKQVRESPLGQSTNKGLANYDSWGTPNKSSSQPRNTMELGTPSQVFLTQEQRYSDSMQHRQSSGYDHQKSYGRTTGDSEAFKQSFAPYFPDVRTPSPEHLDRVFEGNTAANTRIRDSSETKRIQRVVQGYGESRFERSQKKIRIEAQDEASQPDLKSRTDQKIARDQCDLIPSMNRMMERQQLANILALNHMPHELATIVNLHQIKRSMPRLGKKPLEQFQGESFSPIRHQQYQHQEFAGQSVQSHQLRYVEEQPPRSQNYPPNVENSEQSAHYSWKDKYNYLVGELNTALKEEPSEVVFGRQPQVTISANPPFNSNKKLVMHVGDCESQVQSRGTTEWQPVDRYQGSAINSIAIQNDPRYPVLVAAQRDDIRHQQFNTTSIDSWKGQLLEPTQRLREEFQRVGPVSTLSGKPSYPEQHKVSFAPSQSAAKLAHQESTSVTKQSDHHHTLGDTLHNRVYTNRTSEQEVWQQPTQFTDFRREVMMDWRNEPKVQDLHPVSGQQADIFVTPRQDGTHNLSGRLSTEPTHKKAVASAGQRYPGFAPANHSGYLTDAEFEYLRSQSTEKLAKDAVLQEVKEVDTGRSTISPASPAKLQQARFHHRCTEKPPSPRATSSSKKFVPERAEEMTHRGVEWSNQKQYSSKHLTAQFSPFTEEKVKDYSQTQSHSSRPGMSPLRNPVEGRSSRLTPLADLSKSFAQSRSKSPVLGKSQKLVGDVSQKRALQVVERFDPTSQFIYQNQVGHRVNIDVDGDMRVSIHRQSARR